MTTEENALNLNIEDMNIAEMDVTNEAAMTALADWLRKATKERYKEQKLLVTVEHQVVFLAALRSQRKALQQQPQNAEELVRRAEERARVAEEPARITDERSPEEERGLPRNDAFSRSEQCGPRQLSAACRWKIYVSVISWHGYNHR